VGQSWLPLLLKVHKASFVLWFGATTVHVLGHLGEVFRLHRATCYAGPAVMFAGPACDPG